MNQLLFLDSIYQHFSLKVNNYRYRETTLSRDFTAVHKNIPNQEMAAQVVVEKHVSKTVRFFDKHCQGLEECIASAGLERSQTICRANVFGEAGSHSMSYAGVHQNGIDPERLGTPDIGFKLIADHDHVPGSAASQGFPEYG
jgi:hypothetical protein